MSSIHTGDIFAVVLRVAGAAGSPGRLPAAPRVESAARRWDSGWNWNNLVTFSRSFSRSRVRSRYNTTTTTRITKKINPCKVQAVRAWQDSWRSAVGHDAPLLLPTPPSRTNWRCGVLKASACLFQAVFVVLPTWLGRVHVNVRPSIFRCGNGRFICLDARSATG